MDLRESAGEIGCLVTGATRGLGSRVADALWSSGRSLLLTCRTAEQEGALRERYREGRGRAVTVRADLSDPSSPSRILAAASMAGLRISVVVNNAAVSGPIGPFWEADQGEWRSAVRVNLLAPAAICRAFYPGMVASRWGKIVNVSGGGATSPRPRFSAYAASKAGLVRFSETLARELAGTGVDVNCVAPGPMGTGMLAGIMEAGPGPAGEREYEKAKSVLEADDGSWKAVGLIEFLASAASDGITGKLISAVWDRWEEFPAHAEALAASDAYTLRRIVGRDRGMEWGDK